MNHVKYLFLAILVFSISSFTQLAFAQDNYNQTNQTTTNTVTTTTPLDQNMQKSASNGMNQKNSEMDTKMAMRKLWEDHIVYTRNFIISTLSNLPDANAVTQRLLKNQDDMGTAIKPYYGNDTGNKLTKLLREHIMIAAKVVKAAKANNKEALEKAQTEWTANAVEIATFLSEANPNLNKDDLQRQLQKHLDLTTKETSARIKKNWNEDISAYDDNHDHMLIFSDVLVDGIAKQFPDKFHQ